MPSQQYSSYNYYIGANIIIALIAIGANRIIWFQVITARTGSNLVPWPSVSVFFCTLMHVCYNYKQMCMVSITELHTDTPKHACTDVGTKTSRLFTTKIIVGPVRATLRYVHAVECSLI